MGGWVLLTLVALTTLGMLRRSWSRRRRKSNGAPETPSANATSTVEAASSMDFRIHPSSLVNSPKRPAVDATLGRSKQNTTEAVSSAAFRIHSSSLVNSPKTPTGDAELGHSKRPNTSATDHARTIIPTVDFRIRGESLAPEQGSTASFGNPAKVTWYPPGTAITIGRATISDGMVYVCHAPGQYTQHDGCFIDPSLPLGSSAIASALGYWPSYQRIAPDCRRRYLEWLASGKKAPDVDIGYVFLYFYGLERRLLVDKPSTAEIAALVDELKRLRTIYSANGSFDGYSRRLIDTVDFLRSAGDVGRLFIPDLTAPCGDMPIVLKVAIAREVVAARQLMFEQAAAALFGLREFWITCRHVLDKGRPAFLTVLRARFEATFPSGFTLRNRKDCSLRLVYRGATAGMEVDLAARAGLKNLPDPANLTWTKLLTLARSVAEEVAPHVKALAYHPSRANSIAGIAKCPPELRDGIAVEARRWLEGLPSLASVSFGVLASHAIGIESAKWTIRHRREISEALSVLGFAMEPGPEDGTVRLNDATIVQVFRYAGDSQARAMIVAGAAAALVARAVTVAAGAADKVEVFWVSQLASRLSLSADQMTRLRARLVWLRTNAVGLPSVKRMLGELTLEEREFCAWSATVAMGATGTVGKPQIAILEAIHDALGVPRGALYVGLHAGLGAANVGADEPVSVSDEHPEVVHPIPRPPTTEAAGPDVDRLARIRVETERVSAMLADIFAENETVPELPEFASEGPLAGLDAEHSALVSHLIVRPECLRSEFDAAATAVGLMPDGAMEAINEWAFEKYGDALIEDGNPVVVNVELLAEELEAITATK